MGMQKTPAQVLIIKPLINRGAGEHHGQGQRAAGNSLGQAQQIRPDTRLLAGEEGAGTPATHGNLVQNQMHLMAVAQLARTAQIIGGVHVHACRTLHQRLQNHGGNVLMALQNLFQRLQCVCGDLAVFVWAMGLAQIGTGCGVLLAQLRAVAFPEQGHIGYGQSTQRFAVVSLCNAYKTMLVLLALVAPVVHAQFQRNFHGRSAVAGIKSMA